jgi:hypothetical protein
MKGFIAAVFLAPIALLGQSRSFLLSWDFPDTNYVAVTGWFVYTSPTTNISSWPTNWTKTAINTNVFPFLLNLTGNNSISFAVTATNNLFESDPSFLIFAPVKPLAPTNLRISIP